MHDADMMKVLPRIACPTLLVAGEKDFRWGA
jgi:pimeloyl-ACP methyl ester carboxylesterase